MKITNNSDSLDSFKKVVAKSDQNFLTFSPIPALKVHCKFLGKLADTEVLWDTTIQTLASHLQEIDKKPSAVKRSRHRKTVQHTEPLRSFMEVEAPHKGVCKLKVVLPVPIIDEPTIKKTIIMIRCYKRLKVGHHEFGGNL